MNAPSEEICSKSTQGT